MQLALAEGPPTIGVPAPDVGRATFDRGLLADVTGRYLRAAESAATYREWIEVGSMARVAHEVVVRLGDVEAAAEWSDRAGYAMLKGYCALPKVAAAIAAAGIGAGRSAATARKRVRVPKPARAQAAVRFHHGETMKAIAESIAVTKQAVSKWPEMRAATAVKRAERQRFATGAPARGRRVNVDD